MYYKGDERERERESPRVKPSGVMKLCVFVEGGYVNEGLRNRARRMEKGTTVGESERKRERGNRRQ